VALFGVGNALWAFDAPSPGAPPAEIVASDLAQSVFEISQALGTTAASVGIAIFGIASAVTCLRMGGVLSGRVSVFVLAIGLSLLTPAARIIVWPGAAMVLLAVTISVALLRAERRPSSPAS
jgi:hypothetical protein